MLFTYKNTPKLWPGPHTTQEHVNMFSMLMDFTCCSTGQAKWFWEGSFKLPLPLTYNVSHRLYKTHLCSQDS